MKNSQRMTAGRMAKRMETLVNSGKAHRVFEVVERDYLPFMQGSVEWEAHGGESINGFFFRFEDGFYALFVMDHPTLVGVVVSPEHWDSFVSDCSSRVPPEFLQEAYVEGASRWRDMAGEAFPVGVAMH